MATLLSYSGCFSGGKKKLDFHFLENTVTIKYNIWLFNLSFSIILVINDVRLNEQLDDVKKTINEKCSFIGFLGISLYC